MLTAVIIEDHPGARRALADDLTALCPDVVVVGEAGSVAQGVALIERLRPGLVLLDVELEDGSGFEILERANVPMRLFVNGDVAYPGLTGPETIAAFLKDEKRPALF